MALFQHLKKSDEEVELVKDSAIQHAVRGAEILENQARNARLPSVPGLASNERGVMRARDNRLLEAENGGTGVGGIEEGVPPGRSLGSTMTPRGVELLHIARQPLDFDPDLQALFLEFLCECPKIELAAVQVGILPSAVKQLRDTDPGFEQCVQMALSTASGLVEAEAFKIARRGTQRGVWFQGMRVGEETEYRPDLMISLLKATDPRYKNRTEISGEITHNHGWADMVKALKAEND